MRWSIAFYLRVIACAAFFGTGLSASASATETIRIGVISTQFATAIANILKVVIELNFDAKVDLIPGSNPVFFKAMDLGKGDVDVNPAVWLPNSKGFVDEYVVDKKTVALADFGWRIRQGICTTASASEKFNIKSILDLTRPEIVSASDTTNAGKGSIYIGAVEWNSTAVDTIRVRSYGLTDLYELEHGQQEVELAMFNSAMKSGAVVFGVCDTTSMWAFPKGSVVMLEEPAHDPAKWKPVLPKNDPNWEKTSVAGTSWPVASSNIAYSVRLKTAAPDVAKLLDTANFPTETVGAWTSAVGTERQDPAEFAKKWVADNEAFVKEWLARAR